MFRPVRLSPKIVTAQNKDGQEVTAGQVVMDRFGSVCKIMERSQPKATGNVKPSNNEDEFDDDMPFQETR